MPIVKRKPVQPLSLSESLGGAERRDTAPVFYMAATGEVFADYEYVARGSLTCSQYAARLSYYHQRIFQCELSGKSNLTYFEAAESEAQHMLAIQRRFPDPLKMPVLRAVQFQITGRLDNLVEQLSERLRDRFFAGEQLIAEVDGERLHGVVRAAAAPSATAEAPHGAHELGMQLTLSHADAAAADPPGGYVYSLHTPGRSLELRADALSRDRLVFSKSVLRKFLRESVVRDAHVGSPWTVRETLAKRYGLPSEPSGELARRIESSRDARQAKRRKVRGGCAELTQTEEGAVHRGRTGDGAPATARPAPRYPLDDMLLEPATPEELAAAAPGELPRRAQRPAAGDVGLPVDVFEPYLMAYYFFLSVGRALGISPIALDDFDAALRHPVADPPCTLLSEMHAVLLLAIAQDNAYSRDLAPAAVERRGAESHVRGEWPEAQGASGVKGEAGAEATTEAHADAEPALETASDSDLSDTPSVLETAAEVGRGWERRELDAEECRDGWETVLVGCVAARATPEALPRMHEILAHLTSEDVGASPAERYVHLPLGDKVHVLLFLCQLAVLTRAARAHYDECEAEMTELRKERAELARARKRAAEQRQELGMKREGSADAVEPAADEPDSDSDSERDELASDNDEDDDAERYKRVLGSRQESLREKALQRDAEQARAAAEQARAKELLRETKQLNAERRRVDEEEQRIARREEAIEREFRQLALVPRLRPLGRDRFLDRYYWLDGIAVPLGTSAAYQTGRLFVQAPTRREWDVLCASYAGGAEALEARKRAEQQCSAWAFGAWAVYTQPEQIEELIAWLRPKGIREHALKTQLLRQREYIEAGMRLRNDDIALGNREPAVQTRRSTRMRSEQASQLRLPYMAWRNIA